MLDRIMLIALGPINQTRRDSDLRRYVSDDKDAISTTGHCRKDENA